MYEDQKQLDDAHDRLGVLQRQITTLQSHLRQVEKIGQDKSVVR